MKKKTTGKGQQNIVKGAGENGMLRKKRVLNLEIASKADSFKLATKAKYTCSSS